MTKKSSILRCSFCGKDQFKVRKLFAGPAVFICDECTSASMEIIDSETRAKIIKSIHFEPEHRQAGIGILSYFSKYVEERYPDIQTKITIEQDGNTVRMIVEALDGQKDVLEQTLEEYALIVTGRVQPQDFIKNEYKLLELRQKLEMAAVEIRWQERHIKVLEANLNNQKIFLSNQMERMSESLMMGLSNSNNLATALSKLTERPAVDQSSIELVEKIVNWLRTAHPSEESTLRTSLSTISQRNPNILHEVYHLCRDTAHGAAGHVLAMWIAPFLGILPR